MNKRQENYMNMVRATLAFMENKRTSWEAAAPVNDTVTNVTTLSGSVTEENKNREALKTTGLTKDKNQLFEEMCFLAYRLASKTKAYAKVTKNNALLDAVDFTESSIKAGSMEAALLRCETILQKAQDNAEALAAYQVTPEETAALETAIGNYKPLTPGRDAIGDESVAKTTKISTLIGQIREQLDILDDLVEGIFDEEFIAAYKSARQIIDR